jgi:hypothetical protein
MFLAVYWLTKLAFLLLVAMIIVEWDSFATKIINT